MFYVSKISPLFFLLAILNLLFSLFLKLYPIGVSFFIPLVFGFVGTTLVGAMYQIIPNSQNRKLSLPWLSYVVFLGVLLSQLSFYTGYTLEGSGLLFLSYLIFSLHLLANVKNWMPITVKFLGVSAIYLLLSSLFLFLHFWKAYVPLQLAVHTLTLGAMLNAVYGVEIAWIPMLLMETLNVRKAVRLFYAKQLSTLLMLLSFFFLSYRAIALSALLELGVALYYLYLIYSLLIQRRMPSPLPYVVRMFLLALFFLPFGILMGVAGASNPDLLTIVFTLHIDLLVYGFTAFTIFGGMAHLLPRIVWNWFFSSGSKENAPAIGELIDEKGFPRFMELSAVAFFLFLFADVLFSPLNRLSPLLYLFILLYFFRLTFAHLIMKLREVKHGGSEGS